MFSTLICVFTFDRIGRCKTAYWGSIIQGIAVFLAGGFSRLGLNVTADGNSFGASSCGPLYDLHIHSHIRRYLADCPLAVSRIQPEGFGRDGSLVRSQ
jgi:hypothetical protein